MSAADTEFWNTTAERLASDASMTTLTAATRPFASASAKALEALALSRVTTIHFQLMAISDDDCITLCNSLPAAGSLTSLNLGRNSIKSPLSASLLVSDSLTSLNMSANPLEGDLTLLGQAVAQSSLHTLNLSDTQRGGGEGLVAMASALAEHANCCKLRTLHLQGTGITDAIAISLVAPLAAAGICELFLGKNRIGDEGASAFARSCMTTDACGLTTSPFRRLSLMSNHIGDNGAGAFAAALGANCKLHTLNLSHNNITEAGVSALAQGVQQSVYAKSIDVGVNPLAGATEAVRVLKALLTPEGRARPRAAQFRRVGTLLLLAHSHEPPQSQLPPILVPDLPVPLPVHVLLTRLPHSLLLAIIELAAPEGFQFDAKT